MQITNVSPRGDLEVPLLGILIAAGETVDVSEDQARRLLPQSDNYQPADEEAQAIADEIAAAEAERAAELAIETEAGELSEAPAKNASQEDWAAWAVHQGADPATAAAAKRTDLIAEYGTED